MIKLIKNELTKIFHKKSIYIMLGIMVFFTVFGIVFSLAFTDETINALDEYSSNLIISSYEEQLKAYDLTKEDDKDMYIFMKSELLSTKDRLKFKELYKKDYVDKFAVDYINCEVENEVNGKEEEAEECRKKHLAIIKEIEDHDWKYFTNKELKEVEEFLNNANNSVSNDMLESYETRKKGLEYQLKYNLSPADDRISIIDNYKSSRNSLSYYEGKEKVLNEEEKDFYKSVKSNYKIYEYKLDNNILYTDGGTLGTLDNTFKSAGFFVIITIALIAGSVVSDEFNKGTIKQLLIRPHIRSKILFSKLIAVLIVFFIVLLFHYLLNAISSIITGDINELFMPIIRYNFDTDTIYKQNILLSLLFGTLKILPCYLIIMTFSFLASTVTKTDALGILAGIGLFFGGNIFNAIITVRKLWINNFIPTLCWDLNSYLLYSNALGNIILPLIIDIITVVVILAIAFTAFRRTDIKNQ